MKKGKIYLISIDKITNNVLTEQLNEIFGIEYDVKGIFYESLEAIDLLDCDVIVYTANKMAEYIRSKTKKNIPIILAKRRIKLDNLLEVLSIESGSDVLVISNFIEEANITIKLLKEMGISHINLIPYTSKSGLTVESTSISMGEDLAPKSSKNVIYIGEKYIDISTIIEIFISLKIPIEKIDLITKSYNKKIFRYSNYNKNINKILQSLFEALNEGIAFINSQNKIIFCNNGFSKLVEWEHNKVISKNYKIVLEEEPIIDLLLQKKEYYDEIVDYKNKKIILNKKIIYENNEILGFILSIQDITHIQILENTIRKKVFSKGFNAKYTFQNVIGKSNSIMKSISIARKIAGSDFVVLIQGSNGTGKEIFAQAIHNASNRKNRPFIAINLASLSDNLAMSELFGYEEGAFTGALKGGKKGLFEIAHNGTIFLDEIGDASPKVQQRLLRVLQEKEIMPLGSRKIIPIDVRIIAATNRDLIKMVDGGLFRKDLYYRLDILQLTLPDLKDRQEDIKMLVQYFLRELHSNKQFDEEAMGILKNYLWPGNIRELKNLISYLECICDNNIIRKEDLPEKFLNTKEENANDIYDLIINDLKSKKVLKECITILEQLKYAKSNNIKIGRNKLKSLLEEKNIYITIDQLRQRLLLLNNYGLIVSGTTRQGSIITEKGRKFLLYKGNRF